MQLEEDLRVLRHEIRQSGETGVQLPVNFKRLIWNAQKIFKCKPHRPGPSGTGFPSQHSVCSDWLVFNHSRHHGGPQHRQHVTMRR